MRLHGDPLLQARMCDFNRLRYRNPRLLPFPRSFRQVLIAPTLRKEGTFTCGSIRVRDLLTCAQVEFKVNGVKQNYSMKLGEGGEAFFVFETTDEIPASLQTSPLVSPTASPKMRSEESLPSSLQEPEYLDLDRSSPGGGTLDTKSDSNVPIMSRPTRASSDLGMTGYPRQSSYVTILILK